MAKFDAALAVEALEYDFTAYGGPEGVIPEPSTGAVNRYFAEMRELIREARAMSSKAEGLNVDLEEMDAEETANAYANIDDAVAEASGFQSKTVQALANLCSGDPSAHDLEKLPIRVLREFNKWLMQQINPKDQQGTAQRPTPTDRRPATKRSRAGKR